MEKNKFIVYGAGRIGKEIVNNLLKHDHQVEVILDRDPSKIGEYENIPVNMLETTKVQLQEFKIIIGIANPLENETLFKKFKDMGCKTVYKYCDGDYSEEICKDSPIDKKNCIRCVWVESCRLFKSWCMNKLSGGEHGTESVDILSVAATNRCTLNCQACAQCTEEIRIKKAYYDLSLESLMHYMDTIFYSVNYIHQVAITGGEAVLCKELPGILEYLVSCPQIGYVKLLTTATASISEEMLDVLSQNDILVCVDDYGDKIPVFFQEHVQRNKEKFRDIKSIACTVIDNSEGTWYNLGGFDKREDINLSIRHNKECMFRKCLFLSANGIFSWCSRNVSGIECCLIPDYNSDYCDLKIEQDPSKIHSILCLNYLHACEYCNGIGNDNIIRAGIQR